MCGVYVCELSENLSLQSNLLLYCDRHIPRGAMVYMAHLRCVQSKTKIPMIRHTLYKSERRNIWSWLDAIPTQSMVLAPNKFKFNIA